MQPTSNEARALALSMWREYGRSLRESRRATPRSTSLHAARDRLAVQLAAALTTGRPASANEVEAFRLLHDVADRHVRLVLDRILGAAGPRPNSTVRTVPGNTYGTDDRCRYCGEHLADPHAPECPADHLGTNSGVSGVVRGRIGPPTPHP